MAAVLGIVGSDHACIYMIVLTVAHMCIAVLFTLEFVKATLLYSYIYEVLSVEISILLIIKVTSYMGEKPLTCMLVE